MYLMYVFDFKLYIFMFTSGNVFICLATFAPNKVSQLALVNIVFM